MVIAPNTTVLLLRNVPLDSTYKHTIYFSSVGAQNAYFSTKVKYTLTAYTYQRPTRVMRVGVEADNLYDCNYVMFQNTSFGNKWFYAFISNINYLNNGTTELTLEMDIIQTWFFDYTVNPSYVLRQHVMDDTPFTWLAPEPLSPTNFMEAQPTWKGYTTTEYGFEPYITMAISRSKGRAYNDEMIDIPDLGNPPNVYSGIYSGLWYLSVPVSNYQAINTAIEMFDDLGLGDSIVSISMTPVPVMPEGFSVAKDTGIDVMSLDFNGYTIKNNKLLNSPFSRIKLSSTDGDTVELQPELVNQNHLLTVAYFSTSYPACITCIPSYGGISANWDFAVQYSDNPQCAWSSDVYANWLAQNVAQNATGKVCSEIAQTSAIWEFISGAATLNVSKAAAGVEKYANTLANSPEMAKTKMSRLPGKANGVASGSNINYDFGRIGFEARNYRISRQEAKTFDDFLSVYGYQINQITTVNRSGRPIWNYVQLDNASLTGSVPVTAMNNIQSIYQNGITFWNSGDNVGNYSLDNSI